MQPTSYFALVPKPDFRVEDTWFTYGLRGSGSKDIVIADAFVPEYPGTLQRFWRDVHTMRGHVWFDFDNVIQQHARQELGLEPDPQLGP